ncbi:MAG: GspH/FimT family pseudopilin [Burkholderiaceae bacterium]
MQRTVGKVMTPRLPNVSLCRLAGFTMTELMVVLSIATIVLMIGIPSFNAIIRNQKITTATHDFFMAINLTRSEAIRRGVRVDLAPLDGGDWSKGWVIFIDKNNNQIADVGEEVIFSHGAISKALIIKSVFTDSSKEYLAYNGTGRTRTNASGQTPQFGTITFALDKQVRRIKLNFLGRPRSCNPESDSTCTGSADSQ